MMYTRLVRQEGKNKKERKKEKAKKRESERLWFYTRSILEMMSERKEGSLRCLRSEPEDLLEMRRRQRKLLLGH